jgi:hypothetical protein
MTQRDRSTAERPQPRPATTRRVHVCMKQPCNYCLARANAPFPCEAPGGYADLIAAVASELRRRTARVQERSAPRRKSPRG